MPKGEVWEKKIVTMINKIYVAEFNSQTQLSIIVPANTPWAVYVLVHMYFRFRSSVRDSKLIVGSYDPINVGSKQNWDVYFRTLYRFSLFLSLPPTTLSGFSCVHGSGEASISTPPPWTRPLWPPPRERSRPCC